MKPPTTPSRDIFGAEFNGTPSHQRVLKPPGGGTSDIFGANGESVNVRRVKNHLASNVFLSDGQPSAPSTPSRTPGNSHSRLFGPASPPKSSPRPNRSVSKILPLDIDGPATTNGNTSPTKLSPAKTSPVKPVTNGDAHDGAETPATPNGNTSPVLNGNRLANGNGSGPASPTPTAAQQQRQRVPPGGFSSGLW